jgi:hypothetical protein
MVQAYGAIQARGHLIRTPCGSGGRFVGFGDKSVVTFDVTTVCEREQPSSRCPNYGALASLYCANMYTLQFRVGAPESGSTVFVGSIYQTSACLPSVTLYGMCVEFDATGRRRERVKAS